MRPMVNSLNSLPVLSRRYKSPLHSPCINVVCPRVISLVCAKIFATVNSATAEAFLPGAFATIIDFFLQASISILTGPPLETPIYFRFFTLSKIDSLTGARSVFERRRSRGRTGARQLPSTHIPSVYFASFY